MSLKLLYKSIAYIYSMKVKLDWRFLLSLVHFAAEIT